MINKNEPEDKTEAELAQEFREYLKIIGEEISAPLIEQVNKNSENADRISSAAKKLDEDLQNDIRLSVQKSLTELNKQKKAFEDIANSIFDDEQEINKYESKSSQHTGVNK